MNTHTECGTDACCNTCEPTPNQVETFTGHYVDTNNPQPGSIVLEDIAHALSMLCRFGGHAKTFYSVAEHSVFVSKTLEELGESRATCLAGLHHDDAEAYLGDIPRPLKLLLAPVYRPLSDKMDHAIAVALSKHGPPWLYATDFHRSEIKAADNHALLLEAQHLMPSHGLNWEGSSLDWNIMDWKTFVPEQPEYWTGGLSPVQAEGAFLSRHWELIR